MKAGFARAALAALLVAPVLVVAPGPAAAEARPRPPGSTAAAPVTTAAFDASDRDGNDVFDSLDAVLDETAPGDEVEVIVRLDRRPTGPVVADQAREVDSLGDVSPYRHLDAYAATVRADQVEALAARPDVVAVQENAVMRATLDSATTEFGVREARRDFGTNGNADGASTYSKDDIVIAVIDTGIDATHPDLDVGKVLAFRDWTSGGDCDAPTSPSAYDDNGHGTHVASIAAGEGQGNTAAVGVAPGAALVGLKVLNSSGSGWTCDVDAAIQWAIDNRVTYGIDVVNLSLGGFDPVAAPYDGNDTTSLLVDTAAAAGITVVVAAGNGGPGASTVGTPGAARDAITVGNMADPKDLDGGSALGFRLQSSSSRGPMAGGRIKPDLVGPGVDIYAARNGGGYTTKTGTSMAAPFVAGVAALMLHTAPSLTPAQIKSTLKSSAQDWGPAGEDNDYGAGRLDAHAAVDAASAAACAGVAVPTHTFTSGTIGTDGEVDDHAIAVPTTSWPIAVTLIMDGTGSSPNIDVSLLDPDGAAISGATSATGMRQESLAYSPSVTGTYTLRVTSSSGTGGYRFDVSVGPSVDPGADACPAQPAFVPPTVAEATTTTTTSTTTTTTTTAPVTVPVPAPAPAPEPVTTTGGNGYVLIDDKGGLFSFGSAPFLGSVPGLKAQDPSVQSGPIVGAFPTHGGGGYVAYDDRGRVFPFGQARNLGSVFDRVQAKQLAPVRIVTGFSTDGGNGYVLVDDEGGVHTFGAARYLGSVTDLRAAGQVGPAAIIGGFPVDDGNGYVLIDSVGGLFSFGSAKFFGSVPALRNAGHQIGPAKIIGGFSLDNGNGYVMIDDAGGLFAFGTARFLGSVPDLRNRGVPIGPATVVGGFAVDNGNGYVMIDDAGGLFAFGSAKFFGSVPGLRAAGHSIGPADVIGGFAA